MVSHTKLNTELDVQKQYIADIRTNTSILIEDWASSVEKKKTHKAHIDLNLFGFMIASIVLQIVSLSRVSEFFRSDWVSVLSVLLTIAALFLLLVRVVILNNREQRLLLQAIDDARSLQLDAIELEKAMEFSKDFDHYKEIEELRKSFGLLIKYAPLSFELTVDADKDYALIEDKPKSIMSIDAS